MKTIALSISPTVEALRDKAILEENGVSAVVLPYHKAPSFYVGDNQTSQLVVREDQLQLARELLGISEPPDP